jgi:hypothetical protein
MFLRIQRGDSGGYPLSSKCARAEGRLVRITGASLVSLLGGTVPCEWARATAKVVAAYQNRKASVGA